MEFFPEMDPEQIFVDVEAPSGATLETSDEVVRRIEARTGNTKEPKPAFAEICGKRSDFVTPTRASRTLRSTA